MLSMRTPRPLGPTATAGSPLDEALDVSLAPLDVPPLPLDPSPPLNATAAPAITATTAAAMAGMSHRRLRAGDGGCAGATPDAAAAGAVATGGGGVSGRPTARGGVRDSGGAITTARGG